MYIKDLLKKNKQWVTEKLEVDPNYFQSLYNSRSPEVLFISCSDNRVSPEIITGLNPGDLFVHRNIANQVKNNDENLNAVIEFATQALNVKHIVVCGHYDCGGVRAALDGSNYLKVNAWMSDFVQYIADKKQDISPDELVNEACKLNVLEQVRKLKNLQINSEIAESIKIHSWIFNVKTGKIEIL